MPLDALMKLFSPPQSLRFPPQPDDWKRLFDDLRTPLPSDYVAFLERYGEGSINEFLFIVGPSVPQPPYIVKQGSRLKWETENLRKHVSYFEYQLEDGFEYPLHPETPGLLVFGGDVEGNRIAWHTVGKPDDWKVVNISTDARMELATVEFDGPLVEFLIAVIRGEFRCPYWPDAFVPNESSEWSQMGDYGSSETGSSDPEATLPQSKEAMGDYGSSETGSSEHARAEVVQRRRVDVYLMNEFLGSYHVPEAEESGAEFRTTTVVERRLLVPPTRAINEDGSVLLVWTEEKDGRVAPTMWTPITPEECSEADRFFDLAGGSDAE